MASRRQEKVARVIKEAVSNVVLNQLSDPRIQGFVSVTRIEMAPDLKAASVYISIMAKSVNKERTTFTAIEHAANHIRQLVAKELTSKFSPRLVFYRDENFKNTLETMRLIEQVSSEFKDAENKSDDPD